MSAHAEKKIGSYVEQRERAAQAGLSRGPGAAIARRLTPYRFRQWVKLNGTILLAPVSVRALRGLANAPGDVRLNLGSGRHRLPGWINVDLLGMQPDVHWDVRRRLPLADESVAAIFLEHVLEHFDLTAGLDLLERSHRLLRPAGVIRVGVPDFGRYMESYAGDGVFIDDLRPNRPTRLLAVAEVAYSHGHRSVWDAETLVAALEEAGFEGVAARPFGDSDLDPRPDTEPRPVESVYAEGRKRCGNGALIVGPGRFRLSYVD